MVPPAKEKKTKPNEAAEGTDDLSNDGRDDDSVAISSDGEDAPFGEINWSSTPGVEIIGADGFSDESGSSTDDDEIPNPVGDIPMSWYEGFEHLGYDRDGQKIQKKDVNSEKRMLERMMATEGEEWRVVYDEKTGDELILTEEEMALVAKIQRGETVKSGNLNEEEIVAWSGPIETGPTPLPQPTEPKRRFVPSKHEAARVVTMVRAMRDGRMEKPSEKAERRIQAEAKKFFSYDIWAEQEAKALADMTKSERAREIMKAPPPKMSLPTSAESYNPPAEYLPTKEEMEEWHSSTHPEDRQRDFLPEKYDCLRHVPAYPNAVKERFERCLDLYLAVRVQKQKMQVDPDDLIPKLPKPSELRPFPNRLGKSFGPLEARTRSLDVHSSGRWLLSGSDDGYVRVWDIFSGRCCIKYDLGVSKDSAPKVVVHVSWRPMKNSLQFAACWGRMVSILCCSKDLGVQDPEALVGFPLSEGFEGTAAAEDWSDISHAVDGTKTAVVTRLDVSHRRSTKNVAWHPKGDYFSVVARDETGSSLLLHRVSLRDSRSPLRRKGSSGLQASAFHPFKPIILVATQHHIRVHDLSTQQIVKTLVPGAKWISSLSVHPSGDHVLVGSYDKRNYWFDLDLSSQPYRVLRNHPSAVRAVSFHPRLPLFADASDDGTCHVFHATVFSDLLQNALIVPVKMLEGHHETVNSLGVFDVAWHPTQPWLFSTAADHEIKVYVE